MGVLDFESNFLFYGEYHNNIFNVLVHIVFVPVILWSVLVWLSFTGPLLTVPASVIAAVGPTLAPYVAGLTINANFLYIFGSWVFYLLLEPVAATLYTPFLLGLSYSATKFATEVEDAAKLALIIHVVSWIMQFAGHGFAEKRAPALLDSLVQAMVMAPFFVFYEVLMFLGYRPSFRHRMEEETKKRIAVFKASQAAKTK
ncbi:DUF962-domain-containing protein [Ramicandelaber brevisporus]|nr:DUF962-domain-containing protein [Ramicandelaber brevisporus]